MELNYQQTIPNASMALVGSAGQPQIPGYTHTNAGYQNVVVQNNYAYVVGTGGNSTGVLGLTLSVFDIANPAAPILTGYITTGSVVWTSGPSFLNGAYQCAVNGEYLYIFSSGSSKFYIVNIQNASAPYNQSGLTITGSPGSLYGGCYLNGYCYISTQSAGLTVVNVSNPNSPTQTFQEGGGVKSIGVTYGNGYLWTTNYQTSNPYTIRYLKCWSLANPASPTLLYTYTTHTAGEIAEVVVNGNYAYVANLTTSSVDVINISNPASMSYVSTITPSASFNVTEDVSFNIGTSGNYLYLTSGKNATYGGAIDFFDITNPASPVKVSILQQGVANSVFGNCFVANNLIYVANYGTAPSYNASLNIYSTQSVFTNPAYVFDHMAASVQLSNVPSTASGYYSLQGSDDPTNPANFSDIPGATGYVTASGSSTYLIPKTDLSYQYVRFQYTNTGAGGFKVILKTIGVNQ